MIHGQTVAADKTMGRSTTTANLSSPRNKDFVKGTGIFLPPRSRQISASREVTGKMPKSTQYAKYRYNGDAFGGFKMLDTDFPRHSNLRERKREVLRIAAANFQMV